MSHDSIELVNNENIEEAPDERWNTFEPIAMTKLKETISKIGNSSGLENINLQVLKDSMDVIGDHLLALLNESLLSGQFPQGWKQSTVVPIQKITGTTKAEEHRPINIVP